jgi:hypothetical protein
MLAIELRRLLAAAIIQVVGVRLVKKLLESMFDTGEMFCCLQKGCSSSYKSVLSGCVRLAEALYHSRIGKL